MLHLNISTTSISPSLHIYLSSYIFKIIISLEGFQITCKTSTVISQSKCSGVINLRNGQNITNCVDFSIFRLDTIFLKARAFDLRYPQLAKKFSMEKN